MNRKFEDQRRASAVSGSNVGDRHMPVSDALSREVLSDRALTYRRNTLMTATIASLLFAFPGFDTSELRILGMTVPVKMLWGALAVSGSYNALLFGSFARRDLPIPTHPASCSDDIRPLIPGYPATLARHRWVSSLMSASDLSVML